MEVCLRYALIGSDLMLESGGVVLEIEELAERIVELSGSRKIIERSRAKNEEADQYFSDSQKMEEIAEVLGMQMVGIDQQILLTSQAVSRHLVQTSTHLN
jgi:hypothetical protein